jgi:hypothetical protein
MNVFLFGSNQTSLLHFRSFGLLVLFLLCAEMVFKELSVRYNPVPRKLVRTIQAFAFGRITLVLLSVCKLFLHLIALILLVLFVVETLLLFIVESIVFLIVESLFIVESPPILIS